MTVMCRPISCTNSTAMASHVPDVSMAMGQKMCVPVKLLLLLLSYTLKCLLIGYSYTILVSSVSLIH